MCLYFGCGGVGGEWVGGLDQCLEGWAGVMSVFTLVTITVDNCIMIN